MPTTIESRPIQGRRDLEPEEFVSYQLHRTQAVIRTTDVLTAAAVGLLMVAAYLLVFVVFDQWVIPGGFGYPTRVVMLMGLLAGLGVWGWRRVIGPWRRQVSALYAANELEGSQPGLKSNLLTLVDLQQAGRPVSPSILNAMGKRAARELAKTDVDDAVDRRTLLRAAYGLLALVVIMAAYTIFTPKDVVASLWRALLPTADVAVATRTSIEKVSPGDDRVLARQQVEVTVDLAGQRPEEVTLLYTTVDRRFVDEPQAMRPSGEGSMRFRTMLTGVRGEGLMQDVRYRIVAGDAQSSEYTISVTQPPTATVERLNYRYPAYMGFEDRVQEGGTIDAWEGTEVTIHATASRPVVKATVLYSDTEATTQQAEEFPMQVVDGTKLSATIRLAFRNDGSSPQFYRIQLRDDRNDSDPNPIMHPVRIRPDLPPRVAIHHPEAEISAPANGTVPIAFTARDPDFQLEAVELWMEINGRPQPVPERLYKAPPPQAAVDGTYRLMLGPLLLNPGDRVAYWLVARDNFVPFSGRARNQTLTPRQHIDIIAAVDPAEAQKQQEEQQKQAEKDLEAARQQEMNDPQQEDPMRVDEPQEGEPDGDRNTQPEGSTGTEPMEPQTSDGTGKPKSPNTENGNENDPRPDNTQPNQGQPNESSPGNPGTENTGDANMGRSQPPQPGTEGATKPSGMNPSETNPSQTNPNSTPDGQGQSETGKPEQGKPEQGIPPDAQPKTGSNEGGTSSGQDPMQGSKTPQSGNTSKPGDSANPNQQGRPKDRASDDQILRELIERMKKDEQQSGKSPESNGANPKSPADGQQGTSPKPSPTETPRNDGSEGAPMSPKPESGKPMGTGDTPQNTNDNSTKPMPADGSPMPADGSPMSKPEQTGTSADGNSPDGTPMKPEAPQGTQPDKGSQPDKGAPMNGNNSSNPTGMPPGSTPMPPAPMSTGQPSPMDPTNTGDKPSGRPGSESPDRKPSDPNSPMGNNDSKPSNMGEGTSPSDSTSPGGSQPRNSQPNGSSPNGMPPQGTQPNGNKPEGTSPNGAKPMGGGQNNPSGMPPEGADPSTGGSPMPENSGSSETGSKPPATGDKPSTMGDSNPDGNSPPNSSRPQTGNPMNGDPTNGTPMNGSSKAGDPMSGGSEGTKPMSGSPMSGSPSGGEPMTPSPMGSKPMGSDPSRTQPMSGGEGSNDPKPTEGTSPEGTVSQPPMGTKPTDSSASGGEKPMEPGDSKTQPNGSKPKPSSGEPMSADGMSEGSPMESTEPEMGGAGGPPMGGGPKGGNPKGEPSEGETSSGQKPSSQPMGQGPKGQSPMGQGPMEGSPMGQPSNMGPSEGGGEGMGEGGMGEGDGSTPGTGGSKSTGSSSNGPRGQAATSATGSGPPTGGTAGEDHGPAGRPDEPATVTKPQDVNLEDQRRAANLALKELQDQLQRGEVDDDLKRRLGVTDDDLRRFAERLNQRLGDTGEDASPEALDRRRQFEETLRGIEYGSAGGTDEAGDRDRTAARTSGDTRRETPAEYRAQERAYRERLSKQKQSAPSFTP